MLQASVFFLLLLLLFLLLFSFHQQKKSYSLSVNPFLGASVTMKNRFSKLSAITDFKIGFLQASFLNLLTHAVLRGKMDTRWSSLKQLGKIIAQALSLKHVEYNLRASKGVSEVRTVSFSLSLSLLQFVSFICNFSFSVLRFSNIYLQNPSHSSITATPSIFPTWITVTYVCVLPFSLL